VRKNEAIIEELGLLRELDAVREWRGALQVLACGQEKGESDALLQVARGLRGGGDAEEE
jgi:hypothetical protein